jgi:hypothetical protein
MIEEVDATIDNQGRVVTSGVVGQINCNCRLSGMPGEPPLCCVVAGLKQPPPRKQTQGSSKIGY